MKDQKSRKPASVDNIYKLDGRVPIAKAIPFGLQHVLAMFVANVTPVMLIASVAVYNGAAFTAIDTALLIQAAMLVAGIGTLIQLYPVWRIGSRLPVVMGLSFTFLSAMMTLAAKDYGLMIGAVIVGGCTVIMFGAIIVSGVTMLGECGFDQRNTIIAATSFAIGIGVTQVPEFFSGMPQLVSDIFANNPVAGVFVLAMALSLTLPKKIKAEDVGALTEETMESSKPEQE